MLRDGHMAQLAATVGGGEVGPGPASIASTAALQLGASRWLADEGARKNSAKMRLLPAHATPWPSSTDVSASPPGQAMTALHRPLETPPRFSVVSCQFPAFSTYAPKLRGQTIDVPPSLLLNAKVVPFSTFTGCRGRLWGIPVRLRGLNQLRRRTANRAPSEENQSNQTGPCEFHHAFDVADPTRGWKS